MPEQSEMIHLCFFVKSEEVSLATAFVWQPFPPDRAALHVTLAQGRHGKTCCFGEDCAFPWLMWMDAVFSPGWL